MPAVTRDATGHEALTLVTRLLQDARRADPEAGVWEAADLQWWSRRPRPSDTVPQRFWFVDERLVAVAAPDGSVAGYALCWNDPVTDVGLVEPVRVEEEHSGRGLARAMVGTGLDRLTDAGARRLQIGWEDERPRRLYRGLGLHDEVAQRTYRYEAAPPAR